MKQRGKTRGEEEGKRGKAERSGKGGGGGQRPGVAKGIAPRQKEKAEWGLKTCTKLVGFFSHHFGFFLLERNGAGVVGSLEG